MVNCRLVLILTITALFVSVLHAERARNDDLEEEEEQADFANDNTNDNSEDLIDAVKRFLLKKTTTTPKPTTAKSSIGVISGLVTATPGSRTLSTSTKSIFGTRSSSRSGTRATKPPTQDACGTSNPCKNGGTCKTLSTGRFYCFCSQDYYGKTCDNKFISTGAANNDRAAKNHCLKSPCRNGGECIGLRTTYYCRCKSPFYGTNCDKSIAKREEVVDESNSAEQELNAYERDLQEDTEDLRRAIADENMLEHTDE